MKHPSHPTSAMDGIQMKAIATAAARLTGLSAATAAAARCSAMISGGISFTTATISKGTILKSSRYPDDRDEIRYEIDWRQSVSGNAER